MKNVIGVTVSAVVAVTAISIFLFKDTKRVEHHISSEQVTAATHNTPGQSTPPIALVPSRPISSSVVAEDPAASAAPPPADERSNTMKDGAEFDRMFKNLDPSLNYKLAKGFHDEFESQVRDEEWASNMERQLSQHYSSNPTVAIYGSPTVSCKKSICEIKLLSEVAGLGSGIEWNKVLVLPLKQQFVSAQQTGKDQIDTYVVHHDDGSRKSAAVLHLKIRR